MTNQELIREIEAYLRRNSLLFQGEEYHLLNKCRHALEQSTWRDIKDALVDKNILGWGKNVGCHECYWTGSQWQRIDLTSNYKLGPKAITHFMPLPIPPKTQEER